MNPPSPDGRGAGSASICAVLPAYNEADNLPDVVGELTEVLDAQFQEWSVLIVDDGSSDDTPRVLEKLRCDPRIHSLRLRRNFGKSAALRVAFERVDADLVLLMDADGQDDPSQLSSLLDRIDDGCDLVTGRRRTRNDRFIKRSTSAMYNWVTAKVTGLDGSDFNSGFKLMRREVVDGMNIYGELHRYIPVLADWQGFEIAEVDVSHRTRLHGESKFGRNRFWRGMLDLVTVKFLTTYDRRPFHLIGGAGLSVFVVGTALITWMLIERILGNKVGDRPALLAGITLTVVGVQLVCVGLLAELIVHLHTARGRDPTAGAIEH